MRLQDRNCKELEYLYYCLDHEYTEAQCSLRNLKHSDYHRISALKQMAAELRINIFLAVLEKEERGDVEVYHDPYGYDDEESEDEELTHTLADVIESSLKIKQLVDLDGNVLLSEVEADEDFEGNLIQEDMWDLFEGVTPEEEYEGFMGNWVSQILAPVHVVNTTAANYFAMPGPTSDTLVPDGGTLMLPTHLSRFC